MIPPEQLRAIEERCSKASDAPWYVFKQVTLEADAEFIAHARTDLPALVQEVKRLREQHQHTKEWYGARFKRLQEWARQELVDPLLTRFFSIVANGTADVKEPPTYEQMFNMRGHELERLKAELAHARGTLETVTKGSFDGMAALANDMAVLRADNARLREAQLKRDVALNSLFGYASSIQFAEVVEDKGMKFIRMPASWADGLTEYVKEARAALATEKATAATEGNIPSLDTPEPSK